MKISVWVMFMQNSGSEYRAEFTAVVITQKALDFSKAL
jgi:hypothetical protein